jgi:predicted permease
MRNLRLAARMLLKAPFVSAVAVVSLALGIGANAAIFSVFEQVLLRRLPVRESDRLVNLASPGPRQGSTSTNDAGGGGARVFSYPMFRDLEKAQTVFTGLAAHRALSVSLGVHNEPMVAQGAVVSGSYFPVLGLTAAKGRLLSPDDDRVLGGHFVAVISYAFWESRFGSDPAIVGERVVVNGSPFTVVGVAPKGFSGTTVGSRRPVIWVPITMQGAVQMNEGADDRRSWWVYLFARLKPDVSMDAARTAMNAVYQPIIRDIEVPLQREMDARTLEQFRQQRLELTPGARGQSEAHTAARLPILLLFLVTGVVLLIACANIANLLLARGAGRATEMGVRLALGAPRSALVVQLLTESVLLALVGGVASLLIAQWTMSGIVALLPQEAAEMLQFSLRLPVVLFAAGLSVVTGLVFGIFPALHNTRRGLMTALRSGAGQLTGGRAAARFRASLVTGQIALSTVLLITSTLFLRSLVNLSTADLGLNVEQLATFSLDSHRAGYDTTRSAVLFARVEEELAAIPGVTAVASTRVPMLAHSNWTSSIKVQGYPCDDPRACQSATNRVSVGYFAAIGAPLLAGREFTNADRVGSPDVAIVNQAFARRFNLGNDVIGKFMGGGRSDSLTVQIIGLARDIKYSAIKDTVPPVFYRPWRQEARVGDLTFYVRTSLPPARVLSAVRTTMQRLDPNLPVEELKTMPQQVDDNVALDRMISILAGSFSLLATLLASVGLYGVLSYSVEQRTREIGVRMALGADARSVRALVLRQVGRMALIGGLIGIAGALAVGRAARSFLYELQGHDPVAFTLAVVLLAGVALIAGWLPARRASAVDPVHALRYD